MISNKEVFAKRREGAIDEAYKMALELMAAPQVRMSRRAVVGVSTSNG